MLLVPASPPLRSEVPPRIRAALEKAGLSSKDFSAVRTKTGAVVTLVRCCTLCVRDLDYDGKCGRAHITQAGRWRCNRRGCSGYYSRLRSPDGGLAIAAWHERLGVGKLERGEIELAQLESELHGALVGFTRRELRAEPPEQRWVVAPYLPLGRVAVLAGAGGSLKTTLSVQLAVWRALGQQFCGRSMTAGGTVIFTSEDRRDDYLRKLAACRFQLGDAYDADRVAEAISIIDVSGEPELQRLIYSSYGRYGVSRLPDALAAVVRQRAPYADLIVMETISRLGGGAEDNEALSMTVAAAERLARLTDAAVLLVAHVSQEVGRRGVADAYSPRGGSALSDNSRSVLVMTRVAPEAGGRSPALPAGTSAEQARKLVVLTHAKSNAALPAPPLHFEPVSTPYGPVLRQAAIGHLASDPMARYRDLRGLVERLTAQNIVVTERKLRDYAEDLGVRQRQVGRIVDDAVAAGWLVRGDRVRGGGQRLLPGGGPPLLEERAGHGGGNEPNPTGEGL